MGRGRGSCVEEKSGNKNEEDDTQIQKEGGDMVYIKIVRQTIILNCSRQAIPLFFLSTGARGVVQQMRNVPFNLFTNINRRVLMYSTLGGGSRRPIEEGKANKGHKKNCLPNSNLYLRILCHLDND